MHDIECVKLFRRCHLCASPPHKRFLAGYSSPFMRIAEHLTVLRVWRKQCLPAESLKLRRAPSRYGRSMGIRQRPCMVSSTPLPTCVWKEMRGQSSNTSGKQQMSTAGCPAYLICLSKELIICQEQRETAQPGQIQRIFVDTMQMRCEAGGDRFRFPRRRRRSSPSSLPQETRPRPRFHGFPINRPKSSR